MAAKPPEPPRNCINNRSNSFAKTTENINNNTNNNNNNNYYNNSNHFCTETRDNNFECNRSIDQNHGSRHDFNKISTAPSKPTCNCSNISIMHLFHEMKQEFPTIPDHIVAQCVNENCHERENCILMLRNELDLNPIPVQSYPAKVLQRQQQQQKVQQQQQQREYCGRPLKPVRAAPPISVPGHVSTSNSNPSFQAVPNLNTGYNFKNCDFVSNNSQSNNAESKAVPFQCCTLGNCACAITSTTSNRKLDMPDILTATNARADLSPSHPVIEVPRVRPTTLDLSHSQQQQRQQQLRQQLNVQLQQHLHHRQLTKPVRKAPLPPLPPKPTHVTSPALALKEPSATATCIVGGQNGCNSSLSSPNSSGESIASVNTNISYSPTATALVDVPNTSAMSHLQQPPLKSPARHRSVISVQPKPPYSLDYLASPSSSSGGSNSQKSFTSVNLTLRQPNTSGPQSTIDISAGPGLSGGSGTGLTYSSTSYDARRHCQKNFHITVSDAGGLFSASRIQSHNFNNSVDGQEQKLLQSPIMQRKKQQLANFKRSRQQQQQHCVTINDTASLHVPHQIDVFDENLQRQTARRDKLVSALRDNEKRLNQVEQEINILTEPLSPGASERLEGEIQKLRCDCEVMLNELENSKRCVLDMEKNQHDLEFTTNSGQQILQKPFLRQRPPRHSSLARQPMDFVQHHVISSAPTSVMNSPNQQTSPQLLLPTYQQTQQQQQLHRHQLQYLQQQQQQQLVQPSTDEEDYTDSNTDGGEDDMDNASLEMWPCSMCTFRNHPQLNICECCENVRILPGTLRIVPSDPTKKTQAATSLLLAQLSPSLSSPSSASALTHANATAILTQTSETAVTTNNPTVTVTAPAAIVPTTAAADTTNSVESDPKLTQKQRQQLALHT